MIEPKEMTLGYFISKFGITAKRLDEIANDCKDEELLDEFEEEMENHAQSNEFTINEDFKKAIRKLVQERDIVNIVSIKDGFSQAQINKIEKEVNKLMKMYPYMYIEEVNDSLKNEGDPDGRCDNKIISLNLKNIDSDYTSYAQCIKDRKELRKELLEKHKEQIDKRKGIVDFKFNHKIWDECRCLEGLIRHEVAHALTDQYNLCNNSDILNLYNSLSKSQIKDELSNYINEKDNHILEFIAVGFEESFFDDCTDLAKEIRRIMDEAIKKEDVKGDRYK